MDIEITGSYPIILDGETVGELTVTRQGLFWSFEAECEPRREIVRLSVYGDGSEGYLGTMEPIGDMLKLTKKFSRAALREFPEKISYAGQKGELEYIIPEAPAMYDEPSEILGRDGGFPLFRANRPDDDAQSPPENHNPPFEVPLSPLLNISELEWHPCAVPCSLFTGLDEKRACRYISGAFVAKDNDVHLLAVPEEIALTLPDTNAIRFVDEIIFSDSVYLICRIKQGKSVSEF